MLTNFEIMAKSKKTKIHFFSTGIRPNIRNIKKIKLFIELIFKNEGIRLNSINYIFCSDQYLLKINRKFLNHNFYTDIITFDLSGRRDCINADIFISIDRVRNNSKRIGVTLKSEIHRVVFHGALHLCGYKDKTIDDIKTMREKENLYLLKYFS